MKCELCKKEDIDDNVNVGVNISINVGDYGADKICQSSDQHCMGIFSVYLCPKCKNKLEKFGYLQVDVVKELKGLIKESMLKSMILDGLTEKQKQYGIS